MDDTPVVPNGLQILATRVHFRVDTGEILDVHQFIGAPGETSSPSLVAAEMAAGE